MTPTPDYIATPHGPLIPRVLHILPTPTLRPEPRWRSDMVIHDADVLGLPDPVVCSRAMKGRV